jgi:hypothetical protein
MCVSARPRPRALASGAGLHCIVVMVKRQLGTKRKARDGDTGSWHKARGGDTGSWHKARGEDTGSWHKARGGDTGSWHKARGGDTGSRVMALQRTSWKNSHRQLVTVPHGLPAVRPARSTKLALCNNTLVAKKIIKTFCQVFTSLLTKEASVPKLALAQHRPRLLTDTHFYTCMCMRRLGYLMVLVADQ